MTNDPNGWPDAALAEVKRLREARAKALDEAAAVASKAEADTKEVSDNPAYDADTRLTFYTMGRACKEIAERIRALKENTT